ncbi:MAG: ParB N-terminal domain-containing protein [Candidatus Wukongarchaeota archaeon]|nr:ParB N-terminal domain-containing protein [Candidatus Wukongarchaeota archaeon]
MEYELFLENNVVPFVFELCILHVNDVFPHEETILPRVMRISRAIEKEGVLIDPLLVSKGSLAILDGNHRLEALKRMRARFFPACLLPYEDPLIEVKTWLRLVKGVFPEDLIPIINRIAFPMVKIETIKRPLAINDFEPFLMDSDFSFYVFTRSSIIGIKGRERTDITFKLELLRVFELSLSQMGARLQYLEDDKLDELVENLGEREILVLPQKATKEDIVKLARKDYLMPPKSTRHIVPVRPLNLAIPLSLLKDYSITLSYANRQLEKILKSKRVRRLPKNQVIRGRKYPEEILLFEEKN